MAALDGRYVNAVWPEVVRHVVLSLFACRLHLAFDFLIVFLFNLSITYHRSCIRTCTVRRNLRQICGVRPYHRTDCLLRVIQGVSTRTGPTV